MLHTYLSAMLRAGRGDSQVAKCYFPGSGWNTNQQGRTEGPGGACVLESGLRMEGRRKNAYPEAGVREMSRHLS